MLIKKATVRHPEHSLIGQQNKQKTSDKSEEEGSSMGCGEADFDEFTNHAQSTQQRELDQINRYKDLVRNENQMAYLKKFGN